MASKILNNFGTGFFAGAANKLNAQQSKEDEIEKIRQQGLMSIRVQDTVDQLKSERDQKMLKARLEEAAKAEGLAGIEQTPTAITAVLPSAVAATNIPAGVNPDEVDDNAEPFPTPASVDNTAPSAVQPTQVASIDPSVTIPEHIRAKGVKAKLGIIASGGTSAQAEKAKHDTINEELKNDPDYLAQLEAGKNAAMVEYYRKAGYDENTINQMVFKVKLPATVNKEEQAKYNYALGLPAAGKAPDEEVRKSNLRELEKMNETYPAMKSAVIDGTMALDLARKVDTGGILYGWDFVNNLRIKFESDPRLLNNLNTTLAIALVAPLRPVSNDEGKWVKEAGISLSAPNATNVTQAAINIARADANLQFLDFLNSAVSDGGLSKAQATQKWNEYEKVIPLLTKDEAGNVVPNPARGEISYKDYFKAEHDGQLDALLSNKEESTAETPAKEQTQERTVTKREYSPSRKQTRITYSDGTTEIVDGQ